MPNAKLMMANLSGASLQTAQGLSERQLFSTIGNTATSLPQHLQRPPSWGETQKLPLSDQSLVNQSVNPERNRRIIVPALTGASAAIAVALICLLVFQASRLLMAPRGGLGFEPQMTATAGPTEALGQVSDRLHLVIP
jgi:hypothetical protein